MTIVLNFILSEIEEEDHLVGKLEEFCGDFTNLISSFQNIDITIVNGQSQTNLKGNFSSDDRQCFNKRYLDQAT